MELIELLIAEKVEIFNEQRGSRARLDFFAVDLSGKALPGVDLSMANLDKADLSGVDLTDASLYKTSMVGIDGTGLVLARALAPRIRLKEAWLEEADLGDADLSSGDLKEAVLVRSKAPMARMAGIRLVQADANGASWTDADLGDAHLHQADFTDAVLSRSILTEASGQGANFTRARLDTVIASRARLQESIFVEAHLMGARFDGADLTGADFTEADLTGVDFTGANLTGARFEGASLRGAVLADAILEGVDLTDLDLADVDLTGVDPRALGLTEDQLEGVAAVGAAFDPDAPMVFRDVDVARQGDVIAVLWVNRDGLSGRVTEDGTEEELRSVRWCLVRAGEAPKLGVLPTSAEGVLAQTLVPWKGGFQLVLFQERPGGMAILRYPLSVDGTLGASESERLGYAMAVRPVGRADDEGAWVWGMSRTGPTLVVHRLTEGEEGDRFTVVHSEKIPTGRGFLGRHLPVLVCKGGVMMPVGPKGTQPPLRAPDTFSLSLAQAAPHEDRVLAVWLERAVDEERPGGLRTAWLARRSNPEIAPLTWHDGVIALDLLPAPDGVWVAWIEKGATTFTVKTTRLPGEGITELPLDQGLVPFDLRFTPTPVGAEGAAPVLAILTAAGGLVVCDVDAREIGRVVSREPDA